ncbi:MAG: 2-dehydropantoate 2-reductase [Candidatus Pacebacteria bacterium]|nr:2-dehydropantoate 2-reductase [Candidatus Paceibacterota bacterium]
MKICIFGGGAIGGHLAAILAATGEHQISMVARGDHLAAIQEQGLTLLREGQPPLVQRIHAVASARQLPPQEFVFVTVKAFALAAAADDIAFLLGEDSTLVAAINGLPWWYGYRQGGAFEGRRIKAVDPDGILWHKLPPSQVIGCIIYPAAEVIKPGVVKLVSGDKYLLGEPDGSRSQRGVRLSQAMIAAGLKAPLRTDFRDELWVKLLGNLSLNPVCALTGMTLAGAIGNPNIAQIIRSMMEEAEAVGKALGVNFKASIDQRMEGARAVGEHRPSMLQDLERGRPLEIDALLGAVVELGGWINHPMPQCRMILAMIRARAQNRGQNVD